MDLSGVGSQHWKQNSKFIGLFDNFLTLMETGVFCTCRAIVQSRVDIGTAGESHAGLRKKWQRVAGRRSRLGCTALGGLRRSENAARRFAMRTIPFMSTALIALIASVWTSASADTIYTNIPVELDPTGYYSQPYQAGGLAEFGDRINFGGSARL